MESFWKGILVGLGAIAPGLSGSVLLVMFGLYQKTIGAISGLFRDFRGNLKFLLPLGCGIGLGILAFSKLVDFLLTAYEMPTRFAFLGLIVGSIPLFWREIGKNGFQKKYYGLIGAAFLAGLLLFTFNKAMFPEVEDPSLLQSVFLGVAVAVSYVVPGVDSAAILSALGLYNLWVHSLATVDLAVLVPAVVGAGGGVLGVAGVMRWLLEGYYTPTFSVVFGLFLSIVPAIVDDSCVLGWDWESYISIGMFVVAFGLSLVFGRLSTSSPGET